ncbi:hypothetical protein EVAR_50472_1 [Eumeta japonica]|uniref:Uncharacterized protein n=1 Tax=Eumeta variegata TaxID=151549 RepID=A0A4C1XWP1_EUMVA|nr:hypothetical protein EVAR_50472_1 [Eumeta japonica]
MLPFGFTAYGIFPISARVRNARELVSCRREVASRELNKFGSHSLQISESSLEDVTIVQLGRSLAIANHTGSVCTAHGPSSSIRDNLRESASALCSRNLMGFAHPVPAIRVDTTVRNNCI